MGSRMGVQERGLGWGLWGSVLVMIERGMVRVGLLQAADGGGRSQGERLCEQVLHNHWPQPGHGMGIGGSRGNTQDQGQE